MNKALARDCCCLSCNCVTEESEAQHLHFNFTHSSPLSAPPPHRHTTLRQQNGNSVYLVQGVSAGLFHLPLYLKSKKHLDIYLKLHNTENKQTYFLLFNLSDDIFNIQHSGFLQLLTILARPSPSPLGGVHHVHHVQCAALLFICYFPGLQDVEYLETCRMWST